MRAILCRSRAGGEERGSPEPQMEPFARAARTQGRTAAQPRGLDTTPPERKLAAKSPPHLHTPLSPSRARAAPRTRRRAQRDRQRRAQRATHLAAKPPRRHITPRAGNSSLVLRPAARALQSPFSPPRHAATLMCGDVAAVEERWKAERANSVGPVTGCRECGDFSLFERARCSISF